ncbi:MAG TPA: hypothetical protein VMB80_18165 [Candidatus Acidoferrum sp.]|nr:hypothetical protein [Candidatus Acidoferrum sp.]
MSTQILALALLGAVGCATSSPTTRLSGVGPDPSPAVSPGGEGWLQVYTARERVPLNINGEEFYSNSDYGRNDFLYGAAHTDYSLSSRDGQWLLHVSNAAGMNDPNPTRLKLAPGAYEVKAEAADANGVSSTVTVPVCIEAGQTTVVRLDGQWRVWTKGAEDQWVRLADGSVVGWHCSDSEQPNVAFQTPN